MTNTAMKTPEPNRTVVARRPRTSTSKGSTITQLAQLLWQKKAWWLFPAVSVMLLLGVVLVMGSGSALSPFIYALF